MFLGRSYDYPVSARYEIQWGVRSEVQSSSGVIVSTGLGSTGWMRSIATGSCEVAAAFRAGGEALNYRPMRWDSPQLRFAVREPFPSVVTQATVVCGLTDADTPLTLRSLMSENGVIFSDGMEADFLSFNAGLTVTIAVSDRKGQLVQ